MMVRCFGLGWVLEVGVGRAKEVLEVVGVDVGGGIGIGGGCE